jgi:hypothetical protein
MVHVIYFVLCYSSRVPKEFYSIFSRYLHCTLLVLVETGGRNQEHATARVEAKVTSICCLGLTRRGWALGLRCGLRASCFRGYTPRGARLIYHGGFRGDQFSKHVQLVALVVFKRNRVSL